MVGEWPNITAAQHVNKVFASEGHVCTTEGAQTISLQVYYICTPIDPPCRSARSFGIRTMFWHGLAKRGLE
eukprot:196503-Pyramimonas_sp.AAC.1